jgi:hypothetical protein
MTKQCTLLLAALLMAACSPAQQLNCAFKEAVVKIDFGSDASPVQYNMGLDNYRLRNADCPDDGQYSYASRTHRCFNDNWLALPADHTPGDANGRMLLVNAAHQPGPFFSLPITRLKAATTYEVSAWFVNVCAGDNGCTPTPPVISFIVLTHTGQQLGRFNTGQLMPGNAGLWLRYYAHFTTPADVTSIVLKMEDIIPGGCGNDFAVDDIWLRECTLDKPVLPGTGNSTLPVTPVALNRPKADKPKAVVPAPKKTVAPPVASNPAPAKTVTTVNKQPIVTSLPVPAATVKKTSIAVPAVLLNRSSSIVSTIQTSAPTLLVQLYDNGEIDGDTVTVYHNNQLLVAQAALSARPVSFTLTLDEQHAHHELVMVADNLGSIPPNTSLMIVTAGDKRHEIFISSSNQKNATVVFDWVKQ